MPAAQVILQLQSQIAPQIAGAVQGYTQLNAAQQKAELGAARYAQTLQKVALADSKTAVEEQRLAVQTANAAKAQDQAALSALRLANAQEKAGNSTSLAGQFADGLKSGLLGIVGPAALAAAALGSIGKATELAQLGAQAELVDTRFRSLAATAGTTGDALLNALRRASGGQISDLNLQLTANRAQLLGVAHDAQTFAQLMAIARDRAQNLGTTTQSAFDDIVTGVGRASPRILDNLGIIISEKAAYDAFAQTLGKNADALTDNEKKTAILNAVLKEGNATLQATGGAISGTAAGQERLGASIDNLKAKLGTLIANGVAPTVNSLSDLATGFDGSIDSIVRAGTGAQNLVRQIQGVPPATAAAQAAEEGWTRSILEWIAAREVQLGLVAAPTPPSSGGGGSFDFAAVQDSTAAQRAYAGSLAFSGIQARALAQANQQKSDSDKVAAVDAQTHAIAEQQLTKQAQDAANALLQAGPAGARAAALLAGSSQGVDVLTASYYRLFAAKQAAIGPTSVDKGEREFSSKDELAGVAAASAAGKAAALRNQLLQTGTATQVVAQRQKDYNDAIKRFGGSSQQAIGAQTDLIEAQQRLASERDKGARGHTSELTKQLNLNESIYDSIAKQRDAQLDIEELLIRDRQQDRKDAQEAAKAQRILNNPRASQQFKDAAADALALISVQDRKRANELAAKGATAGATIGPNGKLLQSVPGGGGALPATVPIGPLPGGGAAGASVGAGLPPITVLVQLDSQPIAARVSVLLQNGLQQSLSGGGGKSP